MFRNITIAAAGLAIAATAVFAASHAGPFDGAMTARQSHMKLNNHNAGVLFGMAQGKVEYNAEAATNAASNLAALATMSQATYWPQGSDSDANANTRALPALWQNFDDVFKIADDLVVASAAMESVAGDGLDALRGAIGPVGGACTTCHKAYRKTQ